MAELKNSECSMLQRMRYRSAYTSIQRTLINSIAIVKRKLNEDGLSLSEELFNEQQVARLESKRNLLKMALSAFENDTQTINPPDNRTVERAEELAKQVDALIVKDNVVKATLDLATEAFKLFNNIQEV